MRFIITSYDPVTSAVISISAVYYLGGGGGKTRLSLDPNEVTVHLFIKGFCHIILEITIIATIKLNCLLLACIKAIFHKKNFHFTF
jgi:hypothetical protein